MRRYLPLAAVAGALALAGGLPGCASDGSFDPKLALKLAAQAVADTVETVYVRGKVSAAEAAALEGCTLKPCAAGDRILKGDQIDHLKETKLPGFLDRVRDQAIQLVHDTCTKGYLTAADAALLPGLGAMPLDPVFDGNCSELVKGATGT